MVPSRCWKFSCRVLHLPVRETGPSLELMSLQKDSQLRYSRSQLTCGRRGRWSQRGGCATIAERILPPLGTFSRLFHRHGFDGDIRWEEMLSYEHDDGISLRGF